MIPAISSSANLFLSGLSRLQDRITTATNQLSSGYRISQPLDAPDQIGPLLQLQARLRHNQTAATNLAQVQVEVSSADQAMNIAIQLLDSARILGSQGASATTTDAARSDLAQRVQSLQEQMVTLANTEISGRYLFGGDQDTAHPYALNLNQAATVLQNGVDLLAALPFVVTRQIELAGNSFLSVDQTAQTLFDHRNTDDTLAPDNVFSALNSLRIALSTPDNQAGIVTAQASLQAASKYLNSKQSFYGDVQNRITAAVSQIKTDNISLQQRISEIRETDLVQTALELTSATTQNQAAMAAQAKMPHTSLFDFLG